MRSFQSSVSTRRRWRERRSASPLMTPGMWVAARSTPMWRAVAKISSATMLRSSVSRGALLVDDRHGGGVVGAVQHALAPPVVAVLSQPDECGGQLPKVGGLVGGLLARWEEVDVTLVTVPDASSSFVSVTCVNRNA